MQNVTTTTPCWSQAIRPKDQLAYTVSLLQGIFWNSCKTLLQYPGTLTVVRFRKDNFEKPFIMSMQNAKYGNGDTFCDKCLHAKSKIM